MLPLFLYIHNALECRISHCQAMHAFIFFILFSTAIFLETQASTENCTTTKCFHGEPDIRFPFQVRGRRPHHCGLPGFDIDCSNNASKIHFPSYGELGIKSISYDARRLDLLDPKGCVHEVFLNLNLSLTPFRYYYVLKEYSYLNCSVTLSPSFSQVPCLSGSGFHVYTVEPSMAVPNFCRVVKTVPIPFEYSPYLSDNSFGLGLTWGSVGNQGTGCFTMAHVKVACIAILILVLALLARISMHRSNRTQCRREGDDRIQVEKLLGDYKSLKLERCEIRQLYSV